MIAELWRHAAERRNGGAAERRSGGAAERRSGGAAERRSGEELHTPSLTVRVGSTARAPLAKIAASQGRRLADVSGETFEEHIRRHAS